MLYNGQPIRSKSINAVRLYFWNNGNLAIQKSDILSPILCSLPQDVEMLEARVVKVSRDITHLEVVQNSNLVNIHFDILERDDGAAIQIIYGGSPIAEIHCAGVVKGAPRPRIEASYATPDEIPKTIFLWNAFKYGGVASIALSVLLIFIPCLWIYNALSDAPHWGLVVGMLVAVQLLVIFEIYNYYTNYQSTFGVPRDLIGVS